MVFTDEMDILLKENKLPGGNDLRDVQSLILGLSDLGAVDDLDGHDCSCCPCAKTPWGLTSPGFNWLAVTFDTLRCPGMTSWLVWRSLLDPLGILICSPDVPLATRLAVACSYAVSLDDWIHSSPLISQCQIHLLTFFGQFVWHGYVWFKNSTFTIH